eukprot:9051138-Pyramimonas_sp.AAC.1
MGDIRTCSDHVLGIDIVMHSRLYTCFAVYVPHAGFAQDAFDSFYNDLDGMIRTSQRQNKNSCIVIGGDWNSQFNIGPR